jgi:hypothetical protein
MKCVAQYLPEEAEINGNSLTQDGWLVCGQKFEPGTAHDFLLYVS